MILVLLAATSVAAADCPAIGRVIEGPLLLEAPMYDPATQSQVGSITMVKGQVTPTLTIEDCKGRYFTTHWNGRLVVVPRKSVTYHGSITDADSICISNAGGSASNAPKLAGSHAADPLYCSKSSSEKTVK